MAVGNAYTGGSYAGPSVALTAGAAHRLLNCRGAGTVGVLVMAAGASFVELINWGCLYPHTGATNGTASHQTPHTSSPVVFVAGFAGNTVSIINGTLNTSNATVKPVYVGANGNTCLLNNVLMASASGLAAKASPDLEYEVFSANHNQNAGVWHYENRCVALDTSNVYRTGGAGYSLKAKGLETVAGQNYRAGGVSQKGRETYFKDLAAGSNTVTLYGAYVGWAGTNKPAPDLHDLGFAFCYVDGSGNFQSLSTLGDGALEADASAWNNDAGFTVFKVTATVTTNAAQTVPVNIFAAPDYDANGLIYIDPNLVVS